MVEWTHFFLPAADFLTGFLGVGEVWNNSNSLEDQRSKITFFIGESFFGDFLVVFFLAASFCRNKVLLLLWVTESELEMEIVIP